MAEQSAWSASQTKLLRLLRDEGPMHRADLSRRTGISRTTVASAIDALISAGAVRAAPEGSQEGASSSRPPGRPGELLAIDPSIGTVVGLAFTYHEVRVIVTDLSQEPVAELTEPLPTEQTWEEDLDLGVRMVHQAIERAGSRPSEVVGVGLGVPGPLDARAGRSGASSSTAWLGAMPGAELATRLRLPITLENSARLSLLAEARRGAGTRFRNILFVKLSSGVGGGFLVDGRLLRGAIGAAGEIGHMSVRPGGRLCRCGDRGCLEAYASVPAILDAVRPVFGPVDISAVLSASADGDRRARRVLADAGLLVGAAVANAANLFNPEVVIVGGELSEAGDVLLEPVAEAINSQSLAMIAGGLEVVPAQIGARSAALGAVALVLSEEDRLTEPEVQVA